MSFPFFELEQALDGLHRRRNVPSYEGTTASILALLDILVANGLCSYKDYERHVTKRLAEVDQMLAEAAKDLKKG